MADRRKFCIVCRTTNKVLDVFGGVGPRVIMWPRKDPVGTNQLWYVDENFYIRSMVELNKNEPLYLDGSGPTMTVTGVAEPSNLKPEQHWVVNGRRIWNGDMGQGVCMEVIDGSAENGASLGVAQYRGTSNQHWMIEHVK